MLEFLGKFEFLNKIFRLGESRQTAKERLRLVLIHDRASLSPEIMESLKEDLIEIISRYLEIDVSALEIGLEKRDGSIALAANIPIKKVRNKKKATEVVEKSIESPAQEKEPVKKEPAAPTRRTAKPRAARQKRTTTKRRKTKLQRLSTKKEGKIKKGYLN